MVNKKAIIISIVIALIVVAGIIGVAIKKSSDNSEQVENKAKNETIVNNVTNALVENKIEENKIAENTVSENTIENKIEENKVLDNKVADNKTTENKTNNNSSKNDSSDTQSNASYLRDVAISLAKKEWGEDNSVYYSVEDGDSKDEYIVSIRDSGTTAEIVSYIVNVKTKTVKEN